MDVSMTELSRRRTLKSKKREEGNGKPPRLFSLDMMPIDGCFEDVLQQWPLSTPCSILFFIVDCSLSSDGSNRPAVNSRTLEEEEEETFLWCADVGDIKHVFKCK